MAKRLKESRRVKHAKPQTLSTMSPNQRQNHMPGGVLFIVGGIILVITAFILLILGDAAVYTTFVEFVVYLLFGMAALTIGIELLQRSKRSSDNHLPQSHQIAIRSMKR